LHSFPFFFGSLLDDEELHGRFLVEKGGLLGGGVNGILSGDCFLVTAPNEKGEKSTTHRKWLLVYLSEKGIVREPVRN
jgi:hypothetical protein